MTTDHTSLGIAFLATAISFASISMNEVLAGCAAVVAICSGVFSTWMRWRRYRRESQVFRCPWRERDCPHAAHAAPTDSP